MSFTDLIKGRTQKYIKRIPKPGGGYRYIYREHHGGGVANEKHMTEGAAFSLTFNGQKGHFHIISADGDKLKIKHDELHDAEHPGVEMTRAELAALLTREHAPALRENAKKKRDTATRLKTRAPNSLAALAAEKRAKAAEAKAGGEPAPNAGFVEIYKEALKKEARELQEREELKIGDERDAYLDELEGVLRVKQYLLALNSLKKRQDLTIEQKLEFVRLLHVAKTGAEVSPQELARVEKRLIDNINPATKAHLKKIDDQAQDIKQAARKAGADLDASLYNPDDIQKYKEQQIKQQSEPKPRPSNFKTMPESESDYTKAGSVALSRAAKDTLTKARGEALLSGDRGKALELREHAERETLYTGAPAVDKVLGAMLKDAKRSEEPDGSERTEKSGRLPGGANAALKAAVESGHLLAHTDGTLTTYRAAPERAAQTEGSSWRLAVRNGDAFTLTLDTFEAVTTKRDSEEAPLEPEPERDAAQVDNILGELAQLMKANPHLANDPRLAALLGTQGESTAPKTDGAESVLFITGIEGEERTQKARYRLMEAGDVIASHNPLSFATREDYPEGIQERDYHQNRGEQLKVERNAAHLEPAYLLNTNPDATNGPPIITPEGHVLGGNSRAMSLQLAYGRGGEKGAKYKEALTKQAAAFGFNAADVQALKAPVLVRVYEPKDTRRETLARLVRTMNETKTQGLDARIEGRALASKLTDRTLEAIKKGLEKAPEGFTLNRFLTKPSDGLTNVINSLKRDKIITNENAPLYLRDDGTLTGAGREMVALTLAGSVIRDEKTLKAMDYQTFENLTTALGKLAGAGLGPAAKDALESAVTIYDQAIRSNLITARGSIQSRLEGVSQLLEQASLFTGASAGDLDVEKHKQNIKENPLASAFLQILITNKGSAGIDQSISRFIELTEQKEQLDLLGSNEPLDYTEAAQTLIKELAKEHGVSARLFSDIEAERKAAEAAQASSALF